MLSSLLERVLLELVLRGLQSGSDVIELLPLHANLIGQPIVLLLEPLVLIALLWVEIIKARFVGKVDIVDLLLIRVQLILHVTLLGK